ncbi:MAG TPA: hypothetical protein VGR87_02265 [Candidatus Limnocylindria bacterium]|jgi:hypothetical protein|nr:hypothetical protein [Candidatus Limnocylindria bacterium]
MNHHRTIRVGLAELARSPYGESSRLADAVLTLVIIEQSMATAYIHSRTGLLFTLRPVG